MSYRHSDERPPEAFHSVTDLAGHRLDEMFEVDPTLMTEHVLQQDMPVWDTLRIVHSRVDHLDWMHRHWATTTISGAQLLNELETNASPHHGLHGA